MGTNVHNRHVVPRSDGRWAVKAGNGKRASSIHHTQEEAIEAARKLIAHRGGELVIHGEAGAIRDADTVPPGNDPFPPRDAK